MSILEDWYSKEPDGWSQLSTEAQIDIWKSVMERTISEPTGTLPIRIAALYSRGVITVAELSYSVFCALRAENVDNFLEKCPPEVLSEIATVIKNLPNDDDESGWPRYGSTSNPRYPRWLTDE